MPKVVSNAVVDVGVVDVHATPTRAQIPSILMQQEELASPMEACNNW